LGEAIAGFRTAFLTGAATETFRVVGGGAMRDLTLAVFLALRATEDFLAAAGADLEVFFPLTFFEVLFLTFHPCKPKWNNFV
jgi:hypothetical protein